MKQAKSMQKLDLVNLHEFGKNITLMCLVEKSLSEETRHQISVPMGKMNWEEKDKYATELNIILKTSKTEEEILQRAEEALKNI